MGSRQRNRMSLLVRNIKFQTSPDRVREIFERHGAIRDVYLPTDFYTGRPRGFGFVEYYDERDAEVALEKLDQCDVDGNRIEVTLAQRGRSSPDSMRHREPRFRTKDRRGRSRSRSYGRSRDRYARRSNSYDRSRSRDDRRDRFYGRDDDSEDRRYNSRRYSGRDERRYRDNDRRHRSDHSRHRSRSSSNRRDEGYNGHVSEGHSGRGKNDDNREDASSVHDNVDEEMRAERGRAGDQYLDENESRSRSPSR